MGGRVASSAGSGPAGAGHPSQLKLRLHHEYRITELVAVARNIRKNCIFPHLAGSTITPSLLDRHIHESADLQTSYIGQTRARYRACACAAQ
jgi:hypothetical protein